jgi:protein arginine kinase
VSLNLESLAVSRAPWLDAEGDLADHVISSRIRLARNLARIPYPSVANSTQRSEVTETFSACTELLETLAPGRFFRARDLDVTDRQLLVERHLTSPEFMRESTELGVFVAEGEKISVTVNEEDHLRIQTLGSGLSLQSAWKSACDVDRGLDSRLTFDFDRDFGYLTACPTNVGTGLRASVLVHLPALVLTREIESYLGRLSKLGFVARGFYGEGTDVQGNLFQLSNQTTLGQTEEEITSGLESITKQLVDQEREAEKTLLRDARLELEDRVWRAWAVITHARMLNSSEMMNLLSAVRLGSGLGLLHKVPPSTLNELLVLTQPAHLQKVGGGTLSTEERDARRAQLFRERLGSA